MLIMINKYCVGEFNGRRLYIGLRLDYRLRLCAPTSASRAISVVAELLVDYQIDVVICNI